MDVILVRVLQSNRPNSVCVIYLQRKGVIYFKELVEAGKSKISRAGGQAGRLEIQVRVNASVLSLNSVE